MRKIFALSVIFLCFASPAFCTRIAPDTYNWVWNVSVIPPSGGWDTEPGISINTALTWCEREISESSNGIGGHDVVFRRVKVSGDIASFRAVNLSTDNRTIAVMSFAEMSELDSVLVSRMAGSNIPLMLAWGESVMFAQGGRVMPNVFALDMFRDYRASAFAQYAAKVYDRGKRIALAASRFTVNQEREAGICYELLDRAGFMPMPYWTDASVKDSYFMMSEEIESFEGDEAGIVISFLGGMGAREIWRNFMRIKTSWRLWNCAEPDNAYLSCRGMIFADQNIQLDTLGGFINTKRMLFMTRGLQVQDPVAAGRVLALYEWLKGAVERLPQPVDTMPRSLLLSNLGRVQSVHFGNQVLNISPELHRPLHRNAFIVEIKDRKYVNIDTINTRGITNNSR